MNRHLALKAKVCQLLNHCKPETTKKRTAEKQPPSQKNPPKQQIPREIASKNSSNGEVTTRIWANKTTVGEVVWRIDQRRLRSDGVGGAVCRTLRPEHLNDAKRGLHLASKWIKKTERRLTWRRPWA